MKRRHLAILPLLSFLLGACSGGASFPTVSSTDDMTSEKTTERHEVSFDTDGGNEIPSQWVEDGGLVVKPENPVKEHYDFREWVYQGKAWDFDAYIVTADLTLHATYDPKIYTVRFVNNDGSLLYACEAAYGEDADYVGDIPVYVGPEEGFRYVFVGWGESTRVTGDMTFVAQYEAIAYAYTIRYLSADGEVVHVDYSDDAPEEGRYRLDERYYPHDDEYQYGFLRWELQPDEDDSLFVYAPVFERCTKGLLFQHDTVVGYEGNGVSVTIPASWRGYPIRSIERESFKGKAGLKAVSFPDCLTGIGEYAFEGCEGLSRLTLPEALSSISAGAFFGCTGLHTLVNHSPLELELGSTDHGYVAYYAVEIVASYDDSAIVNSDGFVTYASGGEVILLDYVGEYPEVRVLDGVTQVKSAAFSHLPITSLYLPDSVALIEPGIIADCLSLRSLRVPFLGRNASANDQSFNRYDNRLAYVFKDDVVPSSLKEVVVGPMGKYVASASFSDCPNVESIVIEEGVERIGERAFYECASLTSLTIPSSVVYIGSKIVAGCQKLAFLSVPFIGSSATLDESINQKWYLNYHRFGYFFDDQQRDGMLYIEEPYYDDVYGLKTKKYSFPNTAFSLEVTAPSDLITKALYNCSFLKNVALRQVGEIRESALENASGMYTLTLGEGLQSIGPCAFKNCRYLHALEIPDSVTYVGASILQNATRVNTLRVPFLGSSADAATDNYLDYYFNTNSSGSNTSASNSVATFILGQGASAITAGNCLQSTKVCVVSLPSSLSSLPGNAFFGTRSLRSISVAEDNPVFADHDGVLFNKEGNALLACPANADAAGETYAVDSSVTAIGPYSFGYQQKASSVVLPEGLASIGNFAFFHADSLVSLDIPGGVQIIPTYAISTCENLREVTFHEGLLSVGTGAFSDNSALTSVTLPDGLTSIGSSAFSSCDALSEVSLPASLQSISNSAFTYCASLTEFHYRGSVEQWAGVTLGTRWNGTAKQVVCLDGTVTL